MLNEEKINKIKFCSSEYLSELFEPNGSQIFLMNKLLFSVMPTSEAIVYFRLCKLEKHFNIKKFSDRYMYISNTFISKGIGLPEEEIDKSLNWLIENEYVFKSSKSNNKGYPGYRLNFYKGIELNEKINDIGFTDDMYW